MKKLPRLRTAVIGLGGMGRFHCETIRDSVPEMRLAAAVEPNREVAERAAEEFGVPVFASCRELIRANLCDAVTIATPHPLHAGPTIECLKAGLHVTVEKPLAESVEAADRMLAAARKARRAFGCIFQRRLMPFFGAAVDLVRSGRLGRIRRASLVFCDFRTQTYYDSNVWRATWKGEGGGVLLNQSPHYLDLFVQLAGMPIRVRGFTATRMHDIEVEDSADALLEYRDDRIGHLHCSTNEPYEACRIEIGGDRGRLLVQGETLEWRAYDRDLSRLAAESSEMWGRPEVRVRPVRIREKKTGHFLAFRDFARHILFREPMRCDARTARDSLELANAITLSSDLGRPVDLPVSRRAYGTLLARLQRTSRPKKRVVVQRTTDPRLK